MGLSGFDIIYYAHGFKSHKFQYGIRGREVEGTGLIIHFRKNTTGSNPVGCRFNLELIIKTFS